MQTDTARLAPFRPARAALRNSLPKGMRYSACHLLAHVVVFMRRTNCRRSSGFELTPAALIIGRKDSGALSGRFLGDCRAVRGKHDHVRLDQTDSAGRSTSISSIFVFQTIQLVPSHRAHSSRAGSITRTNTMRFCSSMRRMRPTFPIRKFRILFSRFPARSSARLSYAAFRRTAVSPVCVVDSR